MPLLVLMPAETTKPPPFCFTSDFAPLCAAAWGNVFGRLNHIAGCINHGTFLINIAVGSDGGITAGVDVGYMGRIRYGSCICFGAGNADRYAYACNVIFFVCSSRYAQIGYAAGFGHSVAAFGCNNIDIIGCGNVDGLFAVDLAAADGNV